MGKVKDTDANIDELLNSDLANLTPDEATALVQGLGITDPRAQQAINKIARLLVALIAKVKEGADGLGN